MRRVTGMGIPCGSSQVLALSSGDGIANGKCHNLCKESIPADEVNLSTLTLEVAFLIGYSPE